MWKAVGPEEAVDDRTTVALYEAETNAGPVLMVIAKHRNFDGRMAISTSLAMRPDADDKPTKSRKTKDA